jgi:Kef-type K+ transport system membrane component KefB
MNDHEFLVFLLQISTLLAAGIFFGWVANRCRVPVVLGELIGGILLGPTLFGTLAPGVHGWLFPTSGAASVGRQALTRIGMLLFLFVAGMEVDLDHLKNRSLAIAWTSAMGIVLPFSLGLGLVFVMPGLLPSSSDRWTLGLFLGTALSISALPVAARILMDLGLMKSEPGHVVMASAMINDIVGWTLFGIILSRVAPRAGSDRALWETFGAIVAFVALALTVGRRAGQRALRSLRTHPTWPGSSIAVMIVVVLLAGSVVEVIGTHAIFGAFLVGVAMAENSGRRNEMHEPIYQFVMSFLAPLYFVAVGLQVNFINSFDAPLVLIVLLVACLGKLVGVTLGARLGKMPPRQALAVGFGMNGRGAMEIILASVALEHHLIDQRVFVALVIMAIVTTLLSATMMRRLLVG